MRIACSITDITDKTIRVKACANIQIHIQNHIFHLHHNLRRLSEEEVTSAIWSFPRESVGGPDRLHPQQHLNLTSASADLGGKILQQTQLYSAGDIPQSVKHFFIGTSLIPLCEKDGCRALFGVKVELLTP